MTPGDKQWLKQQVEDLNKRDARRDFQRSWVIHTYRIMRAQAEALWADVVSELLRRAKEYNETRAQPAQLNTVKEIPGGVHLAKSGQPSLDFKAMFGGDALAPLRINFTRVFPRLGAEAVPIGAVTFQVNDDGELLFRSGARWMNARELAEALFDTVVEGL
jgi:hypothetical protein